MNAGKRFEEDFKKSIPKGYFVYRLRDSSGAWKQGDNTRFTPSNICDFIVHDGTTLYLFELKSHKGKSLPLHCLRANQVKGLLKASIYPNVYAGLVINFSDIAETYFVDIQFIEEFMNTSERKSIPLSYIQECGVLIEQTKVRTRTKYKINF